ncbi:MAG: efflux RND transporter periplasmic adaptor subunit [Deltaproteobacteria bacterium]|nr:efflux RND transporter periplasmic adaptor subunit [Deltaproteobacteria bacterium]MBZ0220022.1 efflux RND transporter periplasmic adaptor subunit [Deltaproteobacteria bacterium]
MKKPYWAAVLVIGIIIGGLLAWNLKTGEAPVGTEAERKVLYYRNPMNPEITSPVPLKDSMGMDYIPVYEGDAPEAPGIVRISPERLQLIGVRSEVATRRSLERTIRTVGRVEPVENRVFVINAKVPGWVERLYVDRTDQMVEKGQKLLELFSPDLVSAQEEYLLAWKAAEEVKASPYPDVRSGAAALLEAARQRLRYWDISEEQIELLSKSGKAMRTMSISAPSSGSVTEKMIVEGQRIDAGEPLFKIIDHSAVWVYGEIYEYEMPYVKKGQKATLAPAYSEGDAYTGKIEHIYSHLGSIRYVPEAGTEVRTMKVRFELQNPDHRLKLGMYLNVELSVNIADSAIALPDSALIDSGERQIAIIDRRDGTFEPREVKTGGKADGFFQVLQGVSEGEWVVTQANFLIDSESKLKAAVAGLSALHDHAGSAVKMEGPRKDASGKAGDDHSGHAMSPGRSGGEGAAEGAGAGRSGHENGSHESHPDPMDLHEGH